MKTRVSFVLVFLCVLLWVPPVLSKKHVGQKSNGTFSFDGSTTSTSSHLPGMTGQAEYWEATGSASISGTATELGQDRVYDCELWLMATGDLDSSAFPDKGNIASEAESDGSGAKQKIVTRGDASILYRSHPVGSMAPDEINFGDSQVQRTLSGSLSESYSKRSYSSPTGLCASPEFHGDFSGTLMNFVGSQSVLPLSFRSKENKACADSLDDGMEVIAGQKCKRGSACLKPGTATALYSHRVECDKDRWVDSQTFSDRLKEQFGFKTKKVKEKCDGVWWTCDDDPKDYKTYNICQHVAAHVPDSESHLEEKYVDSNGNTVDPNTVTLDCGHLLSASGDHTLQASCSVTNNRGQRCTVTNFYACQSHTHTYPPGILPTKVCGSGHTYVPLIPYFQRLHKDRMCLRCGQTYQNCTNTATACQNRRKHTQKAAARMDGACGHTYRINARAQHALVTCSVENSAGDTCTGGSYYACQSHTHTYPASTPAPTPTPSPPENSNPNNNDNEEEEEGEAEEEVPAAPPAPTVSYHPCGQHLTTVSGDHSLQASCSTDATCIATSFYQCQHSSHTYPAPTPTPTPTVVCPADSWTSCGGTTSHASTCSGGHSYYTCASQAWHQDRTCTRCSQTYQNCGNSASACQSNHWHTDQALVACGGKSWTGCTARLSSKSAHRVSCTNGCGNDYWTCGSWASRHTDAATCQRPGCGVSFYRCSNGACTSDWGTHASHWAE
ncbi:MAG: hypothetical protein OYL97_02830 [Candidatus Poribacteria bacterium]|nr:hypothetical protein [Candidatus Poribacteria bacterium]